MPSEHPKNDYNDNNPLVLLSYNLTERVTVRVNAEPETCLGVSSGADIAGRVGQQPGQILSGQKPGGPRVVRAVRDHGKDVGEDDDPVVVVAFFFTQQ